MFTSPRRAEGVSAARWGGGLGCGLQTRHRRAHAHPGQCPCPAEYRVNTVHPTAVRTAMAVNPAMVAFRRTIRTVGAPAEPRRSTCSSPGTSAPPSPIWCRTTPNTSPGDLSGRRRLLQQAVGRDMSETRGASRASGSWSPVPRGDGTKPRRAAGRRGRRPDPGGHLRVPAGDRYPPEPGGPEETARLVEEHGRRAVTTSSTSGTLDGTDRRCRRRCGTSSVAWTRRWPTPGCSRQAPGTPPRNNGEPVLDVNLIGTWNTCAAACRTWSSGRQPGQHQLGGRAQAVRRRTSPAPPPSTESSG